MSGGLTMFLLVAVMMFSSVHAQHKSRLVFNVDPKWSECFHLEIEEAEIDFKVNIELAVIRGGLLDILVDIKDPNGDLVLSHMYFEGKGDRTVSFVAFHQGDYTLCFDNTMSRWTPKVVSFKLQKEIQGTNKEVVKPEHLSAMESSLGVITNQLSRIQDEQTYLKDRESAHTATLTSTYNRLTMSSLLESGVLLSLAFVQIYFVRKWFANKRHSFV